jgi:ATP sulfurylase
MLGLRLLWLVLWLQPFLATRADAQEAFSAACAFDGGRLTFVISGENAQAGLTRPNAVWKYADEDKARNVYVTSDIRRPAILVVVAYSVPSSPTAMVSRSTYVIDTDRGSFSQIVENRSQQDNSNLVLVQSGTCSVARNQK